ncbi:hypothetical protein [Bacillus chungangensis]|uniref:Uncharacterized protein n=1 Tax=Bacillus chungangensis TaxID=587633 RepID=A0ABT9WQ89_9BACI|nr:hypothetical protein [Bacillus chungangensis]MDQ0175451.1 hypothetical protein [Bacillus chungangensis]
MGTFYCLGIINKFTAMSQNSLLKNEWENLLNERIDLNLYETSIQGTRVEGSLIDDIFKENIIEFYQILKEISGPTRSSNIDYYEKEFGTNINDYQTSQTELILETSNGNSISLSVTYVLLFIEGKVSVEEFNTEPHLINWLFRNSRIENKLSGCVISDIV